MAAGAHFVKKNESCVFIWIEEKCKRKWISDIRRPFCEKKWKLRFHLNWWEMQTKINFGHPKWPPAAIFRKKMKVVFWSEMVRNANENEFRTSRMATGNRFDLNFDLKYWEVQTGWRQAFWKNESFVLIWNGENCKKNRWASGSLVLLFAWGAVYSHFVWLYICMYPVTIFTRNALH